MFGSFSIGRVLGITVRVHWLFVVLIAVLLIADPSPAATAVRLAVLFGVVFLHELGHSLVARRFGIRVLDITFWPLGGMARLSEIPERSRVEFWVAIAGPAVNFVLAGLGLGVLALLDPGAADRFVSAAVAPTSGLTSFTLFFVVTNLLLGVFNLVPAFPMDGGRILRAFFARKGDWLGATERAVTVGRLFAFAMIAGGVILGFQGVSGSWSLVLIGFFVWWAGTRELFAVRLRHGEHPLMRLFRQNFGARTPPVASAQVEAEPLPTDEIDPSTGARRPVHDWRTRDFGKQRLDDDAIARLERFQGRLGEQSQGE